MFPKKYRELAQSEIDPSEYSLLRKDFAYCRQHNLRHFQSDLKEILDKIAAVIESLLKDHILDINMQKWSIKGFDDPKTLLEKTRHLIQLLSKLYGEDIEKGKGKIGKAILPKRKGLLIKYMEILRKQNFDPGFLEKCETLLDEIVLQYGVVSENLDKIVGVILSTKNVREMRTNVNKLIAAAREPVNAFFEKLIELLNKISHFDSITEQLKTSSYTIEDHIFRELIVRDEILTNLNKGKGHIKAGSFEVLFLTEGEKDDFVALHPKVTVGNAFDEVSDYKIYEQLKKFISDLTPESVQYFVEAAQNSDQEKILNLTQRNKSFISAFQKFLKTDISETSIEHFISEFVYFNRNDHYIILKHHDGTFEAITSTEDFINKVLNFLIFHKFKGESFDRMINSIIEPFFLNPLERLSFNNHKSGLATSWKIARKVLDREEKEGDITGVDKRQIFEFMKRGYAELGKAQIAIAKQIKIGGTPKFANFVKRPYLVHQLMMYVLKIAIFSEARAKFNMRDQLVYTGRDSGYEGGNTVAVHGYNNFLKYHAMVKVVSPILEEEVKDFFDDISGFKGWLTMALHDAATYDRQNSVSFSKQIGYGNNNKKAHELIGSYLMCDNKVIRVLFNASNIQGVDLESEGKNDLHLLASIINRHDCSNLYLDVINLGITNPKLMKQFVLLSLSGIADNSAGIGFLDEHDKVRVDSWEEKGSSVFLVEGNREVLFEILRNLSRDKGYYGPKNGPYNESWTSLQARVRENIIKDTNCTGIVQEKLLKGFEEGEFTPRAATSTAGIINSGFMRFVSYDGKTLRVDIIMDKDVNKLMSEFIGEKYMFKRLEKFVEPYGNAIKGQLQSFFDKGELKIFNKDKEGKTLNSIGLDLRIIEMKGVLNITLIEDASKQLLDAAHKAYYTEKEFKEAA